MARRARKAVVVVEAEWRVQARAAQAAYDAAVLQLGADSAAYLVYGQGDGQGGTVHAEAIAEDVDRTHGRYLRVVEHFQRSQAHALDRIERFRTELGSDPAYTLGWAESAFEEAGKLHVARMVLGWLAERGPAGLLNALRYETTRRATSPSRSSAQASNLMEQYLLAAYAQAHEELTTGWLSCAGVV